MQDCIGPSEFRRLLPGTEKGGDRLQVRQPGLSCEEGGDIRQVLRPTVRSPFLVVCDLPPAEPGGDLGRWYARNRRAQDVDAALLPSPLDLKEAGHCECAWARPHECGGTSKAGLCDDLGAPQLWQQLQIRR